MRPFKSLISYEEARGLILRNTRRINASEKVEVADALGSVVAGDVTSAIDVPGFDRSAMDGFAVAARDTFKAAKLEPVDLELKGAVLAGGRPGATVKRGYCVEVATGAPLPRGADAVVMFEDTEREGTTVKVFRAVHPGANMSRKGSDIKSGDVVLRRGEQLTASKVGVLSALGFTNVKVFRRPRVAIVPTGTEVQTPGEDLGEGRVYDINSATLSAIAEESGCAPVRFDIVPDDPASLDGALRKALEFDGAVVSGGSSVGTKDILADALSKKGEMLFHGVQIKPGKPVLCARVEGRLVMGMPGYPASCLTIGYLLLAPHLRRLARLPERMERTVMVPLARRVTSDLGRHEFLTVRLEKGRAHPAFKESGAITSLAHADGYIEIPLNVDLVEKGEVVEVKLF